MNRLVQRYRYSAILLRELVKTDFKLRYQGSALGYMWSLLRPLALFLILYIVFARFLKFGGTIPHYPVYLLLGIMLWNYFVEVTSGGVGSIVAKGDLLRKLNFPKYIIVIAGSMSALINLALNFIVLGIFMVLGGADIGKAVVLLPFILLELFVLSIGLSFLLSALYVKFRDINYIWEVVLQAAFYATPILYPLSLIPTSAAKILMMNPMAQIIQDARHVLITPKSETITTLFGNSLWHAIPVVVTVLLALVAALYFRNRSKYFAEEV
jgi:ABC-2 type transport system permease protein